MSVCVVCTCTCKCTYVSACVVCDHSVCVYLYIKYEHVPKGAA